MGKHERVGLLQFLNGLFCACSNASVAFVRHHADSATEPVDETFFSLEFRGLLSGSKLFYFAGILILRRLR